MKTIVKAEFSAVTMVLCFSDENGGVPFVPTG